MPDYRNVLTDNIYQLESSSGQNRDAYIPNSVGALGGYQLTPNAFKDVQTYNPKVWGKMRFNDVATNDALAREAASEYLGILSRQLEALNVPLDNTNLMAAYHSGAGNVKKGLGPQGLLYQTRARALAGVKPGESW